MKRILTLFFSLSLLFSSAINTEAKSPDTTADVEYIGEDLASDVEVFVTLPNKTISFSVNDPLYHSSGTNTSTKQKTTSKTYQIKNTSGTVIATYTLTGTFQYNGSSSSCIEAHCSTSVSDSYFYFNSKSARKVGNTASGSFTLSSPLQTLSETLTLECNSNGTIQ